MVKNNKETCGGEYGDTPIEIISQHIMQNVLQVWKGKPEKEIRPKLGDKIHIFDLQSRLASTLISSRGLGAALYAGGVKYGKSTAHYITLCSEVSQYIRDFRGLKTMEDVRKSDLFKLLNSFFEINGSGILSIERYGPCNIVFELEESSEAYGLPDIGKNVCHFPCGFLTGFMSAVLDKDLVGKENKCVANGDNTCEFTLRCSLVL